MTNKIKRVMYVLLSALLELFLYILFHEAGHLIVMLSAGATITDFSIITAHVSAVGGNYTNLSDLWLQANGALLPVIVALVYMLFYKKEKKNFFYIVFSYVFSLIPIMSMLAWVIIPFLYMQGNAPIGDDVTNFLFNFTQSNHPLTVSVISLLIMAIGITVMIKKDIFKNFILMVKER